MRIAQIAPLAESVPPRLYGGTERVVHYLTEELVGQGHDVTLFASGDSRTSARLVATAPRALRLDPAVQEPLAHLMLHLEQVRRRAGDFDILHFHTELLHFPLFRSLHARSVTTLHGRLDVPELAAFYDEFHDMPLVSISDDQRARLASRCTWAGTVHHGLPLGLLRPAASPRCDYLAFLGRISPEKRLDRAVEIARRAGMALRVAAKADEAEGDYVRRIAPLLGSPGVEFIGEIGDADKAEFLGNAAALVFPIDWPEPFGLALIEAMACGTPVIAWRCGAVEEVVEDGVTGCIVDDESQAAHAATVVAGLDRARVRRRFEERFSAGRMAREYVAIYESLPLRAGRRRAA